MARLNLVCGFRVSGLSMETKVEHQIGRRKRIAARKTDWKAVAPPESRRNISPFLWVDFNTQLQGGGIATTLFLEGVKTKRRRSKNDKLHQNNCHFVQNEIRVENGQNVSSKVG